MTYAQFAFYALGEAAPQGSKIRTRYGMRESSDGVKPWRETVVASAPAITAPLDGPLAVKMVFTVARPKGAAKRQRRPATSPDIDKLARSTADALKTAGLIRDDGRICEYVRLAKVWTGYDDDDLPVPGVIVACCELADLDARPDSLDGPLERLWYPFDQARREAWQKVRGVA